MKRILTIMSLFAILVCGVRAGSYAYHNIPVTYDGRDHMSSYSVKGELEGHEVDFGDVKLNERYRDAGTYHVSFPNGTVGTVEEIRLVHTKIATLDNKVVYVPNGTASGATVVNYSEKETRRVDQVFHISYESDANKALELLLQLADRNPAVLKDPAPFAKISGAGDSSIELTTRLWCKGADYWDVYFYMLENAKPAFDAAGISIPYQQIDVHMKN